jgi:hypothetical protein
MIIKTFLSSWDSTEDLILLAARRDSTCSNAPFQFELASPTDSAHFRP